MKIQLRRKAKDGAEDDQKLYDSFEDYKDIIKQGDNEIRDWREREDGKNK